MCKYPKGASFIHSNVPSTGFNMTMKNGAQRRLKIPLKDHDGVKCENVNTLI